MDDSDFGMEQRSFETSLGEVWVWASAQAFSSNRPIMLGINGAFSIRRPPLLMMQPYVPRADVVNIFLPGNHCPPLRITSITAYARAYEEVFNTRFANRPMVIYGSSVGGLVAMAMTLPSLKGMLLAEPPLVTDKLWPLIDVLRKQYSDPISIDFIESVLGYMGTHVEGRDYRYLLDRINVPTRVVLGGVELGERRKIDTLPSLVEEPERALMRAHPLIRTTLVTEAGHNILAAALMPVIAHLNRIIDATIPP